MLWKTPGKRAPHSVRTAALGVLLAGFGALLSGQTGSPTVINNSNDPKLPLDISGYLSFRQLKGEDPGSRDAFREYAFSLFLDKAVGDWRFHSEFNSEKSPHFDNDGILFGPDSVQAHLHTAWANYQFRDELQAQAGFLFVPTYWRTHRYQSITLTVADPLIDRNIFPSGIVGAMAHGNHVFDNGGFSYTVYGGVTPRVPPPEIPSVSAEGGDGGEGADGEVAGGSGDTHTDVPDREYEQGRARSAGGTFLVHMPVKPSFRVFDVGFQYLRQDFSNHFRAQIYGFESRIEKWRFALLSEFAHSSILNEDGDRAYLKQGLYVQPSFRVRRNLFAVYRYDVLNADSRNTDHGALTRHTVGVTYRPIASLSLKAEYNRFQFTQGENPTYSGASAGVVYYFLFR